MITRDEYKKAIEILKKCQDQLFAASTIIKIKEKKKTVIEDWVYFNKCSLRLQNVLIRIKNYYANENTPNKILYLEDIKKEMFLDIKYAGSKTWREFLELRGY